MSPIPVLGWDAPRAVWLDARRKGMGASDVAAALGFSRWNDATPWNVWAQKTGRLLRPDKASAAAALGHDLEPWLIGRAPDLLGQDVQRTPHQLYAHPEHAWQLCSPDAFAADGGIVEAKTAGLAGWETPQDWADGGIPLGYEFQARWQMMVMDRPRVHVIGLVAGHGLLTRTVDRDVAVELNLARQVTDWWTTHVVGDVEPQISFKDLDALAAAYRQPGSEETQLPPEALDWQLRYLDAGSQKRFYDGVQKSLAAEFKARLGNSCLGKIGQQTVVTWNPCKGDVDWERMARDLAEKAAIDLPDPETYRKPSGRTLSVKKSKLELPGK